MNQHPIIGIRTDAQTFDGASEQLFDWLSGTGKHYVSTATVYTLMMAYQSEPVRLALAEADMVTADGMPLVWLQRAAGYTDAERVYGPDVLLQLCKLSNQRGGRHYFWGGLPGVAQKLADNLTKMYSHLEIAGACSPGNEVMSRLPDSKVVQMLNEANADVIWVGLGSPKQDLWMHAYRPYLKAPLLVGVGAAFDFLAGVKPQAPQWMQQSGLEWLYRLVTEPRRMWRRYLVYNPWFVALVISERLKRR